MMNTQNIIMKHTQNLPQLGETPFLTDGGLETTLIFQKGIDLPYFAAFDLLKDPRGRAVLREYFDAYAAIACRHKVGFILESPTWRATPDWAAKIGYTPDALERVNREAIGLMRSVQDEHETCDSPMVVSGCIGPRGDGYRPLELMSTVEAALYHGPQIRTYRDAGADLVTGITINYINEALGIVQAAADLEIPSVISFTVETDGRLPDGTSLAGAIEIVDALAKRPPAYYMINCAHPAHFLPTLAEGGNWTRRIHGIRANASGRSHAELDESTELDAGDAHDLGRRYRQLQRLLPNLNVYGGCCGTDERHIEAICHACFERDPSEVAPSRSA